MIKLHLYQIFSLKALESALLPLCPVGSPFCGGDGPFSLTSNPCSPQPKANLMSGDRQGGTQNRPAQVPPRQRLSYWGQRPTHHPLCPLSLAQDA